MSIGNIGTGKGSSVKLMEEYNFATVGTSNAVWVRRLTHGFSKNPLFVDSGHAASNEVGYVKETVHSAQGSIDFELDATTIGWLLKWIMNTAVATINSTQNGATGQYKHIFKFGAAPRTVKVYENKGGLATPYYMNYLGMLPTNLSVNLDMSGTLRGGMDFIGQTSSTSDTGTLTPSLAASNLTFAWGDVSYKYKVTPNTAIASMDAWTDPFDFELNLLRVGASNQNFISDGNGKPNGVYEGVPAVNLKLAAEFTSNHKHAVFESGTEVAFGLSLDTGVQAGTGLNYKIDFTFPRVRFEEYQVRMSSPGKVVAVIPIKVMEDPTAGYSVMAELYNTSVSYPDAIA
jgi:hypothetical protein